MSRYSNQNKTNANAGSNRGLSTSRLVNVGSRGSFPRQSRDFSTLGRPSNINTYTSQKFQDLAFGEDNLLQGQSALSNGTFRPTVPSDITEEFVGSIYNTPDQDPSTFYLLTECADYDAFILTTEVCDGEERIEWLTICDI